MAIGNAGSSFGADTVEGGAGFAQVVTSNLGSELLSLLMVDAIVPGSPLGYQTAKTIFSYHPLGLKLAGKPVQLAQSQRRKITVQNGPSELLIKAFEEEWNHIGGVGCDAMIFNTMTLARVYGIASLACGERDADPKEPLDLEKAHEADLFFNVLDPLNTAGSLVLNQDPNSGNFQKPGTVYVAGKPWHSSRLVVVMNEQPIYIEWTDSAYGFVGRSIYQRGLFPLKTFVQTMITNDHVTKKVGLLVWMAKATTSVISNRIMNMFGWKRGNLQSGMTGNVLQIGHEEKIESLNFQNLEGAAKFARDNCLKDIGASASMPARMVDDETLSGNALADGSEDAKRIAQYIDGLRTEMAPLYAFTDDIVMRRAWSPEFYRSVQREFPEYRKIPHKTAFYRWKNSFSAEWPNLLTEPESKLVEVDKVRFEAIVALVEVLSPLLEGAPREQAKLVIWAAEQANERKQLFGGAPIDIDPDELERAFDEVKRRKEELTNFGSDTTSGGPDEEPRPRPFARAA